MSDVANWYVTKYNEGDFGNLFYLKQLQDAQDGSGGGIQLLGSEVQWIDKFMGQDYAIPQCFDFPQAILNALVDLNPGKKIVYEQNFKGYNETIIKDRKSHFELGIGSFPFIPVSGGLDLDYSLTECFEIAWGEGCRCLYIPTGLLCALHSAISGCGKTIGSPYLKKNAIVRQVVVGKNYSVQYKSTADFTPGFNLKFEQWKTLPKVEAALKVDAKTERDIVLTVNGTTEWVLSIGTILWKDLS